MNRFKKGAVVALAVTSLAIVGCQNQGGDDAVESIDTAPSMDMTSPSDGATESMGTESTEASPSEDAGS
jgi:uncharacterized lipoprotein NlpE involved in copper resistance